MAALECDKPVIAAVNGAAVGWGMELALYADIRIASERAVFAELFIKRGLICDVGGLLRLPAIVAKPAPGRRPSCCTPAIRSTRPRRRGSTLVVARWSPTKIWMPPAPPGHAAARASPPTRPCSPCAT